MDRVYSVDEEVYAVVVLNVQHTYCPSSAYRLCGTQNVMKKLALLIAPGSTQSLTSPLLHTTPLADQADYVHNRLQRQPQLKQLRMIMASAIVLAAFVTHCELLGVCCCQHLVCANSR